VTIADGMILVAATAAGMVLLRAAYADLWRDWAEKLLALLRPWPEDSWGWTFAEGFSRALLLMFYPIPLAAAWTMGMVAIRLRSPRPALRRVAREPGFVACAMATLVVAAHALALWAGAHLENRFSYAAPKLLHEVCRNAFALLASHAGWAVLVGWLTLALSGRWRGERCWIDRLGRLLGAYWIATALLCIHDVDRTVWWGNFLWFR
jgi:hypothetical protein